MAFPMPLVIDKTRTVRLGAEQGTRQTLAREIQAQSLADLHSMLIGITHDEAANQERMGNPPTLLEVDGRTKPLNQAQQKVVVLFGIILAAAAMRMVEQELRAAIAASTRVRTGRLIDIGGSWEWRYIPKGGTARVVSSAASLPSFSFGDMLTLTPIRVPYATAVNRRVATSGRMDAHNAPRRGKKPPPKSSQQLGFLATTTRALRRRSEFRQFNVRVEFTRAFAVPGEVKSKGTGVITIRPRFRGHRPPKV